MAQTNIQGGPGIWTSTDTAASTTVQITLPAGANSQKHRLLWVAGYAVGATVANLNILKGDGTTAICRIGGTGTGCLDSVHTFSDSYKDGGLVGYPAADTFVNITATSASAVQISACWCYVAT